MNRNILKSILAIVCLGAMMLSLIGCGSAYEVTLPIGDGKIENDNVICNYKLHEKISDGYKLEGYFNAESDANLDGKFVLSISFDDRYASVYAEDVLFEFEGSKIKEAKGGKLRFSIEFTTLSNTFPKDKTSFTLNFHRVGADRTDVINWNTSDYNYEWKDGKIIISR